MCLMPVKKKRAPSYEIKSLQSNRLCIKVAEEQTKVY